LQIQSFNHSFIHAAAALKGDNEGPLWDLSFFRSTTFLLPVVEALFVESFSSSHFDLDLL
jgi:hypothetical protein